MHRQEVAKRADAGASQMAGLSIGGVTILITSSERAHHFAWRYLNSHRSTTSYRCNLSAGEAGWWLERGQRQFPRLPVVHVHEMSSSLHLNLHLAAVTRCHKQYYFAI